MMMLGDFERYVLAPASVLIWLIAAYWVVRIFMDIYRAVRPRIKNPRQPWKRRLMREWERTPLPAPRPDCVVRTGRLF